jgi:hypothetical protein
VDRLLTFVSLVPLLLLAVNMATYYGNSECLQCTYVARLICLFPNQPEPSSSTLFSSSPQRPLSLSVVSVSQDSSPRLSAALSSLRSVRLYLLSSRLERACC